MKKLLAIISVLVLVAVAVVFFLGRDDPRSSQPSYATTTVTRGDLEIKVMATGTIEPYTRVEVSSSVSGRIDEVEVDEGDVVGEGDILAWISSEDRIALLDAARSGLESAQRTGDPVTIQESEAAYEIAEKAYKPIPLTNSISGEVISRSCEPGQNVSTQSVLFAIADRLVANVQVDEVDIGKISHGQEAWITLDAFPEERRQAKVSKISREAELISDVVVYDVMVEPLMIPSHWASGMTANVEFMIDERDDVLLIPKSAVTEQDGRSFVIVMAEEPRSREIQTGISDGVKMEVTEGLREGETIVASGAKAGSEQEGNRFKPPMGGMLGGPRR
jgi:macrolide-specific efflux system membrane fusion protein